MLLPKDTDIVESFSLISLIQKIFGWEIKTASAELAPKPDTSKEVRLVHLEIQTAELWLGDSYIATIKDGEQAEIITKRLQALVAEANFDPETAVPTLVKGMPGGMVSDRVWFVLNEDLLPDYKLNKDLLAIEWINNLRTALGVKQYDLVTAQTKMYDIKESDSQQSQFDGLASWYGPYFHGRLTANGEIYDQFGLTAAHPSLKLNTYLKITNLNNNKSLILRVNDRGPYIPPRTLDLSLGSARCLGSVETGVIPYQATIMERNNPSDI